MHRSPKISIVTICYNQEKYIRQAIDSFLMQKTDFEFEIVVADDASTDKTQDILREYRDLHPNVFNLILRRKNIGAVKNSIEALKAAKGEYIALCEGDDYWTDELKLHKQAEFLDNHPSYALCFHPVKVFFENNKEKPFNYPEVHSDSEFSIPGLLKQNFIQTNSVMYKKLNYEKLPTNILPLDWYLHLYHAKKGDIGFINEVMAAYRRHAGGLWWGSHSDRTAFWNKYAVSHMALYIEFLKLYGGHKPYRNIIYSVISKWFEDSVKVGQKTSDELLLKIFQTFPKDIATMIVYLSREIQQKNHEIYSLKHTVEQKDNDMEELRNQIKMIKSSRVWKARNYAAKIIKGKRAV
jgi:glycosyltransferase involved in cell wall biosynthesis